MSFDLSIVTIGYSEPTLWAAVAIATALAILAGHLLGRALGRIHDPWRRRLYGLPASGLGSLAIVVVTVVLLDQIFSHYHRGMVCTAFVTPALFLPAVVGMVVECLSWTSARRAQSR